MNGNNRPELFDVIEAVGNPELVLRELVRAVLVDIIGGSPDPRAIEARVDTIIDNFQDSLREMLPQDWKP